MGAITPPPIVVRMHNAPVVLAEDTFVAVDEYTTDVLDEITTRLRPHLLWWPVGLGMQLGLPVLFAFRAWKTRRLLQ